MPPSLPSLETCAEQFRSAIGKDYRLHPNFRLDFHPHRR